MVQETKIGDIVVRLNDPGSTEGQMSVGYIFSVVKDRDDGKASYEETFAIPKGQWRFATEGEVNYFKKHKIENISQIKRESIEDFAIKLEDASDFKWYIEFCKRHNIPYDRSWGGVRNNYYGLYKGKPWNEGEYFGGNGEGQIVVNKVELIKMINPSSFGTPSFDKNNFTVLITSTEELETYKRICGNNDISYQGNWNGNGLDKKDFYYGIKNNSLICTENNPSSSITFKEFSEMFVRNEAFDKNNFIVMLTNKSEVELYKKICKAQGIKHDRTWDGFGMGTELFYGVENGNTICTSSNCETALTFEAFKKAAGHIYDKPKVDFDKSNFLVKIGTVIQFNSYIRVCEAQGIDYASYWDGGGLEQEQLYYGVWAGQLACTGNPANKPKAISLKEFITATGYGKTEPKESIKDFVKAADDIINEPKRKPIKLFKAQPSTSKVVKIKKKKIKIF